VISIYSTVPTRVSWITYKYPYIYLLLYSTVYVVAFCRICRFVVILSRFCRAFVAFLSRFCRAFVAFLSRFFALMRQPREKFQNWLSRTQAHVQGYIDVINLWVLKMRHFVVLSSFCRSFVAFLSPFCRVFVAFLSPFCHLSSFCRFVVFLYYQVQVTFKVEVGGSWLNDMYSTGTEVQFR
jgi:hypothetical protein